MKLSRQPIWDLTPSEAVQMQKQLQKEVQVKPYKGPLRTIAGADISFNKYSKTVYAGFVVLDVGTMEIIETAGAIEEVDFPYIPGLLSFREIPPLVEAWKKLKTRPDVLVLDGHGIAHPRRVGIASHAGLLFDLPTIGCAKTLLTGIYEEPSLEVGATSPLVDRKTKEQIGLVLRTKKNVSPVFISPGHRMDFQSALKIMMKCLGKYRIPEPTRQAHLFVNQVRLSKAVTESAQIGL